ncbi:hypothetical protein Dsin_001249 [Dipteronia sinensis]|uniref:Uncharacterized protein n=1 Tax=Dipteronia sinensis TaxID=43782 RepID=A0AAE0B4E5_9ROSI|nr:hypothetical protein Dsin_001249 [Dipteronia sinensis]
MADSPVSPQASKASFFAPSPESDTCNTTMDLTPASPPLPTTPSAPVLTPPPSASSHISPPAILLTILAFYYID